MYQRFGLVEVVVSAVSFIASEPLAPDAEHESNGNPDQLIRDQEENGCDRDHHEHHSGGDRGFAARRPGHLAPFLAHFLQEAEGADPLASHLCRRLIAHPCSLLSPLIVYMYVRPASWEFWQEWRDSNPQPPVLETGALAIELHSSGKRLRRTI